MSSQMPSNSTKTAWMSPWETKAHSRSLSITKVNKTEKVQMEMQLEMQSVNANYSIALEIANRIRKQIRNTPKHKQDSLIRKFNKKPEKLM